MKTTFELPDSLFRSAKAAAASAGLPLRELFTQAIAEKLQLKSGGDGGKPWMKGFGTLGSNRALRKETHRIQSVIDSEFGAVNAEDWEMIVDTNALSAFADGDKGILPALRKAAFLAVPVIVLGEFHFGIQQSRHRKSYTAWIEENLPLWRVLDVTRRTAKLYGKIRAELKQAGTPIPENDVWIAALAREHDQPLLTHDAHFDRVARLAVVGW